MERLRCRPANEPVVEYHMNTSSILIGEESEVKEKKGRGGAWGIERGQAWAEFVRG